ncbi:hypothetical protein JNB88_14465 [Rhizobium cauense]|uniref:hypothetical protein n=1 Tax=Rhizobium cauense TaxID=1166683 RepID=UPI001C6DD4A0|nr:hypothetical protein [Rhizobium cauense]MBW9114844.1 hypothetical protein [Rhizobium cauense]
MARYTVTQEKPLPESVPPSRLLLDRRVRGILWTMFAGAIGMTLLGMVFSDVI